MAAEFPGWIAAPDAVEKYGIPYHTLRKLIADEVLTRGRFSAAVNRPPIYVRVDELEAWRRGGVDAVAELRHRLNPNPNDPVPTHDTGENGAG